MVDTGELEGYLNEKSAVEGDGVEITEEGIIESKVDAQTGRKYKLINLPVKLKGTKDLIYTPNKDAIDVFQKKFGMDTKKWVGAKFSIKFYPKTSFGVTRTAILPVFITEEKVK